MKYYVYDSKSQCWGAHELEKFLVLPKITYLEGQRKTRNWLKKILCIFHLNVGDTRVFFIHVEILLYISNFGNNNLF